MLNSGNALCYLLAGGKEDELELLAHLLQELLETRTGPDKHLHKILLNL